MNFIVLDRQYLPDPLSPVYPTNLFMRMDFIIITTGDKFYYYKNRGTGITGVYYPIAELPKHIQDIVND